MSRILLVEDNPLNRVLARDVLRLRGHHVVEATTLGEARRCLDTEALDLVLLDIQVPGGGGEALLQEIRRDDRHSHLPVVAVTAYAMPNDRDRFLAQGFDGYLSKPIDTRRFGPDIEAYLPAKDPPSS